MHGSTCLKRVAYRVFFESAMTSCIKALVSYLALEKLSFFKSVGVLFLNKKYSHIMGGFVWW